MLNVWCQNSQNVTFFFRKLIHQKHESWVACFSWHVCNTLVGGGGGGYDFFWFTHAILCIVYLSLAVSGLPVSSNQYPYSICFVKASLVFLSLKNTTSTKNTHFEPKIKMALEKVCFLSTVQISVWCGELCVGCSAAVECWHWLVCVQLAAVGPQIHRWRWTYSKMMTKRRRKRRRKPKRWWDQLK